MTAAKRTVLLCDAPRCRARFLGELRAPLAVVRLAAKRRGWESWTTSEDMFRVSRDHCPEHARR